MSPAAGGPAPIPPAERPGRKPLLEARNISKYFGAVIALEDVSLTVRAGEINCLLGDNGAGKSSLIKTLSGVHPPDAGTLAIDGEPVRFASPRDALDAGIATVYQDLSVMPLMSISRNFFLGNEPTIGFGPFRRFDSAKAATIAREEMKNIGIDVRDTEQLVGTLSGGERQTLAIARAEYFGARVLILDEPTSALGVKESAFVLRHAIAARNKGLGVIFITHNVQHALPIGDSFTILTRGRSGGTYRRGELNAEQLHALMGGGSELEELQADLEMLARREEAGEDLPTVPLGTDHDAAPLAALDTDSAPTQGENQHS
ncbi:MAG: sugar ABC transporter ATP-binding protein [Chloroflexi bacterium]|nr:sugar ABC transporter ATP-binding protein [Chloroflexota bacterium]